MILALDLGTKLGTYRDDWAGEAWTKDLGKGDERFFNFLGFLYGDSNCDIIVYEQAAFQRGHAIPIYHGLVGVLKAFCMANEIEHVGIPVGTIKKCFTGKGNCGKKEIMDKCDTLGIGYEDDNSADAYAVYYTYKKLYGVE